MCDYLDQDVTGLDRLELVNLLLQELDAPDTKSVQLEKVGARKTTMRTYYVELDLSGLEPCDG